MLGFGHQGARKTCLTMQGDKPADNSGRSEKLTAFTRLLRRRGRPGRDIHNWIGERTPQDRMCG